MILGNGVFILGFILLVLTFIWILFELKNIKRKYNDIKKSIDEAEK